MEKKVLVMIIIGLLIQCLGIGIMLYGTKENETAVWVGTGIMAVGLFIISLGLIALVIKKIKKSST